MRILVFGDSITQGFHDDEMGGWCNRLAQYAIRKTVDSDYDYSSSIFNLGISGNNTDNLVKRFPHELKARLDGQDGAVLFALGVNDSQFELGTNANRVELEKYEENIKECINEAKKYTEHVFINSLLPVNDSLLSPMPWKPTHGYSNTFIDKYNETVKRIAAELGCVLIDISDVFPNTSQEFLPDGIRPNAEGHRLIYVRVKSELEKAGIL